MDGWIEALLLSSPSRLFPGPDGIQLNNLIISYFKDSNRFCVSCQSCLFFVSLLCNYSDVTVIVFNREGV